MAVRMVMENTLGLMVPISKENGKIMSLKVTVNIDGLMVEVISVCGKIIRWMDKEKWSFKMLEFIKENSKMIK